MSARAMLRPVIAVAMLALPALLVIRGARPVDAEPVWGANCRSCHDLEIDGAVEIFGADGVLDPDESGTGAPDRGLLPVFRAAPGQTKSLTAVVAGLIPEDTYAVELRRLRHLGVVTGGILEFDPDCDWASWGSPGQHFSDPPVAYRWGEGPDLFEFEIDIAFDADPDAYDLVFAVAGKVAGSNELYVAERHFYLQITTDLIFADGFESGDTAAWSETSGGGR